MKVSRIDMVGFMSHNNTTIELPERGVVLVDGDNGSGKSSMIEAVSMACWGKTLRGKPPWQRTGHPSVSVRVDDGLRVTRSLNGKTTSLSFIDQSDIARRYDTATKAQEALDSLIDDRAVWLRSHVFSSSDAGHFTGASDGDRKRLLEVILGLDRFDRALDACRADMRKARGAHEAASRDAAVHSEKLAGIRARMADAEDALDAEPPAPVIDKNLPAKIEKARDKLRVYRDALAGVEKDMAELAAASRARSLPSANRCPTCGQPVADRLREKVAAENARLAADAAERQEPLEGTAERLRGHIVTAQEVLDGVLGAAKDAKGAEVVLARRAAAKARLSALQGALDDAVDLGGDLTDTVAIHALRCRLLVHAEKALGLQGVRAHLLGQALHGVEAIANTWLGRIASTGDTELSMRLMPYAEKVSGGTRDAISLEIDGAGNGYGYAAASGGERRRIDVAILLALAEVASAAHGRERGTLFFDEVFDALDQDGVMAVDEIVTELAHDTCVVIISHSQEILRRVGARAVMRIQMRQGRAEVR